MSEAINIIKKAVNTNFKEPLNKLIEKSHSEIMNKTTNNTSGCSINPALSYGGTPTIDSNATRPYLTDNNGEVTTIEAISSSPTMYRRLNEAWFIRLISSVYYLYVVDITTGLVTLKQTFTGTKAYIFTVTETYVYGYETISSVNYLFRYNKLTGEYVRSVNAIDSFFTTNYSYLKFIPYGDTLHAYFLTTSTTNTNKGYYEITDILDYGGAFSYVKLNDNILELFKGSSYSDMFSTLELEDNYVLVVTPEYYSSNSYYYCLCKINVLTGEYSFLYSIYTYITNIAGVLCPIEHEGKVIGALFGVNTSTGRLLVKIKGSDVTIDSLMTLYTSQCGNTTTNSSKPNVRYSLTHYKDGIYYMCDLYYGEFIKDANLMVCDTNYVCYIPKGTKYYNSEIDRVLKVIPKLRDSISIEDGEIKYMGYVECNEDHVFEFTEGGFYFIPGSSYYADGSSSSDYGQTFHLNGTFF